MHAGVRPRSPSRPHPKAFSLVEVVIASAIIAVMLVAAIGAAGAAGARRQDNTDRAVASYLATSLMDEVRQQSYSPAVLAALESVGSGSGTLAGEDPPVDVQLDTGRASFTTLDHYTDYVDKPPTNRDGSIIPGASAFERRVTITYANPANPDTESLTDQGLRRVVVTVKRRGITLVTLTALRAAASDQSQH